MTAVTASMLLSLTACAAGFILDSLFGDPVWLYHPVRLIGNGISIGERPAGCCGSAFAHSHS